MTKEEITKLRKEMGKWKEQAKAKAEKMDKYERKYLNNQIEKYERKNSKRLAYNVVEGIAELLELENPLDFCVDWKWDGFFGIKFVAKETFLNLKN